MSSGSKRLIAISRGARASALAYEGFDPDHTEVVHPFGEGGPVEYPFERRGPLNKS